MCRSLAMWEGMKIRTDLGSLSSPPSPSFSLIHTHPLSLFHASLSFSLIHTHSLTLYRLPSLSLSRNLSFYRSHLSFDLSTSSTDNSKHLPTFLLSLFPSFSLTHTLTHSKAFSHSITTNSSLNLELFSGRRWRFISAQLSNKFGYCLSQTVSG